MNVFSKKQLKCSKSWLSEHKWCRKILCTHLVLYLSGFCFNLLAVTRLRFLLILLRMLLINLALEDIYSELLEQSNFNTLILCQLVVLNYHLRVRNLICV